MNNEVVTQAEIHSDSAPEAPPEIDWAVFLGTMPPNRPAKVAKIGYTAPSNGWRPSYPDIRIECGSDICEGGDRIFEGREPLFQEGRLWTHFLLYYTCRNCRRRSKVIAVRARPTTFENSGSGEAVKLGESPPFGPSTPSRVLSLIGPDREVFLQGRRAENQGMGIGAFAYYRRVVENQKNRLLDEIIKVARRTGAGPELIRQLEEAKRETRFSSAVEVVTPAVPPSLLVGTHNPLSLLHNALSQGIHAQNDEECLEIATSIRVVLTDLAERLDQALRDHAELNTAVSRLMRATNPQHQRPGSMEGVDDGSGAA